MWVRVQILILTKCTLCGVIAQAITPEVREAVGARVSLGTAARDPDLPRFARRDDCFGPIQVAIAPLELGFQSHFEAREID